MTAACAAHPTLDWHEPADYPQAAAICEGCELRAGCEAGARERGEQFGCWGGVVFDIDGDAADFMLTGIPAVANVQLEHSRSAYNAKAHGPECKDCAAVNATYKAKWLAQKRDVTGAVGLVPEQLRLFIA